jgi:TonB family protein
MKKLIIYLFVCLLVSPSFGQSGKTTEVYTVTEEMPEYPGGVQEMMNFVQNTITYPAICKEKKIGGKVFLKFIVGVDGKITDAQVLKSSGVPAMDDEALRVLSAMPAWKPGKMSNKAVPVYYNLPIAFSSPDPYFVFNVNNKNENYLNAKKSLENGDTKSAISFLKSEDLKDDLDAQYNLGVLYFWGREKENSCKCFNAVINGIADKNSQLVINSQKFSKYCN